MDDNMELLMKAMDIMERQAQVMTSMHERTQALTESNAKLTEALNAVTAELERLTKAYQMDACGLDDDDDDDEEDTPKLAALLSEPTVFDSKPLFPRYRIDDEIADSLWFGVEDTTEGGYIASFGTLELAQEWLENHQEWLDSEPGTD